MTPLLYFFLAKMFREKANHQGWLKNFELSFNLKDANF